MAKASKRQKEIAKALNESLAGAVEAPKRRGDVELMLLSWKISGAHRNRKHYSRHEKHRGKEDS